MFDVLADEVDGAIGENEVRPAGVVAVEGAVFDSTDDRPVELVPVGSHVEKGSVGGWADVGAIGVTVGHDASKDILSLGTLRVGVEGTPTHLANRNHVGEAVGDLTECSRFVDNEQAGGPGGWNDAG